MRTERDMKIALRVFWILIVTSLISVIISVQAAENPVGEKISTATPYAQGKLPKNNSIDGNINYNIKVILDHIFISKKNSSLEVSEAVVFRNEGSEIYYYKDNHTFFAISTPPDVKNLKTEVMECCLVQEEGMVFMDPMQSIKPGDNFEMQISYMLDLGGEKYLFNKSAVYNTTSLSIFVDKKEGTSVEGPYETITLHGNDYNAVAFSDLKAGETVSIQIKTAKELGYLYAGIGLLFLFSILIAYRFKDRFIRKRNAEDTLRELEIEKRKIFQAIRGFEKHTGTESSDEYRRLMEDYRQKAIRVFIKIDKIRSKINKEPLEEKGDKKHLKDQGE